MSITNDIKSLDLISFNPINYESSLSTKDKKNNDMFSEIYDAFVNIYDKTNSYQNKASELQLDFATGKTDDMLAVMLAQEEAYTSLNFAMQITNKIVAAYKEIQSIQL